MGRYSDLLDTKEPAALPGQTPTSGRYSSLLDDPATDIAAVDTQPGRTLTGTLGDVATTVAKGVVAVPEALTGLADLPTGGRAGKLLEEVGVDFGKMQEGLDQYYSPAQKAANQKVSEAEGFVGKVKAAVTNPSTIAVAVGESLPLMLTGGAAGRILGSVANLAKTSVLPAAFGEGVMAAGSAAEGIRQQTDDGLLTGKQALLAGGAGAGTALFGFLGGKVAQKLGIADVDIAAAGGDVAAAAANKGITRRAIEGAFTEGVLEELPQSVQEQMLNNIALDKDVWDGVDEAAAMGMLAGAAMGGPFAAVSPGKPATPPAPPKDEIDQRIDAIDRQTQEQTGQIADPDLQSTVEAMLNEARKGTEVPVYDAEIIPNRSPERAALPPGGERLALPEPTVIEAGGPINLPSDRGGYFYGTRDEGQTGDEPIAAAVVEIDRKIANLEALPEAARTDAAQANLERLTLERQSLLNTLLERRNDLSDVPESRVEAQQAVPPLRLPDAEVTPSADVPRAQAVTEPATVPAKTAPPTPLPTDFPETGLQASAPRGAETSQTSTIADLTAPVTSGRGKNAVATPKGNAFTVTDTEAKFGNNVIVEDAKKPGTFTIVKADGTTVKPSPALANRIAIAKRQGQTAPYVAPKASIPTLPDTNKAEIPAAVVSQERPGVSSKQPWQMTPSEYVAGITDRDEIAIRKAAHPQQVKAAIASGEAVPTPVLEAYKANQWAKAALGQPAAPSAAPSFTTYTPQPGDVAAKSGPFPKKKQAENRRTAGLVKTHDVVAVAGGYVLRPNTETATIAAVKKPQAQTFTSEFLANSAISLYRGGLKSQQQLDEAMAGATPLSEADKLRRKADALMKESVKILEGIEPGQPVLSAADRTRREKAAEKARQAVDLERQAEDLDAGNDTTPTFSPDDLDAQKARAGYAHTSHTPSVAAGIEQRDYVTFMEKLRDDLLKDLPAGNDPVLAKELERVKQAYLTGRYRVLSVRSNAVSAHIAGGSKFNSKQAGQRSSAVDRAEESFDKAMKAAVAEAYDATGVAKVLAERRAENDRLNTEAKAEVKRREQAARNKELTLPIVNEPGGHAISKEAWAKVGKDYKSIIVSDDGTYRYRSMMVNGGLSPVFVTDMPVKEKPAAKATEQPAGATLTGYADFRTALRDGKLTEADFKATFTAIRGGKDALTAELETLTKPQLFDRFPGLQWRYKNEKKADVVDAAYRAMLTEFVLGDSLSYGMGKNSFENAVQAKVDGYTQADLDQYAADLKRNTEERQQRAAEMAEAVKDPKTLEDFVALLRGKMSEGLSFTEARMTLTTEQRAAYDALAGEKTRSERKGRREEQRDEVRTADQKVSGEIIETTHTQKGHALFVVQLSERVSKDDYATLNAAAKKLGGYYSSFRGRGAVPGFQFKTRDEAEAFNALAGGDKTAAQDAVAARRDAFDDNREQTAVERLRDMADALEERAQASLSQDRKANTSRRASMAASAEAAANSQLALAKTMRNIADAVGGGTAQFLDRVRQKVQVEYLSEAVRLGKWNELKAKYPEYGEREKRNGERPTIETADFADWPTYTMYRSDLAKFARELLDKDGTKKLGQHILKYADDVTAAYEKFAKENISKVATFARKDGGLAAFASRAEAEAAIARSGYKGKAIVLPFKRGENLIIMSPSEAVERGVWQGDNDKRITLPAELGAELVVKVGRSGKVKVPWQLETVHQRRELLKRMGIEQPAEFRAALREFIALQEGVKEPDKIKQMERAMIGRKKDGLDFFPTPQATADEMVATAGIEPGMSVLEPSAGMGHIAERIREAGVDPDVIELSNDRKELLEAKGFNVVGRDFLEMDPRGFTYGDTFRHKDGRLGVMRGSGGLGSGRVGFIPEGATERTSEWVDRDDLTGVSKNGSNSGYDRIIMNPPFSDRRDAEHVQHAYELLKPGGRLVALMGEGVFFGNDKKAKDFRDWLDSVDGTSEKLDDGTFLDPTLPVNTGVNARMIVIEKPAAPMYQRKGEADANSLADVLPEDTARPAGVLAGEPAKFKRQDGRQGIAIADLEAAFNPADYKGLKGAITFVQTEDELPINLQRDIDRDGLSGAFAGVYWLGQTYLIGDNLSSVKEGQLAILHESRHFGLDRVMGAAEKRRFMAMAAVSLNKQVVAWLKSANMEATQENRLVAAEEVLVDMVRRGEGGGIIDKFLAKVAQWVRSIFPNLKLTQAEMRSLIAEVDQFVKEGEGARYLAGSERMSAEPLYAAAWHGSPKRGIDRFDSKFIGTGEGAQAFGYGHYFSGVREIAEYYKNKLSELRYTLNGEEIGIISDENHPLAQIAKEIYGESKYLLPTTNNAVSLAGNIGREELQQMADDAHMDHAHKEAKVALRFKDMGVKRDKMGGLYAVELAPAEDEYLRWDLPLSEQSGKVRGALANEPDPNAVRMDEVKVGSRTFYILTSELYGNVFSSENKAEAEAKMKERQGYETTGERYYYTIQSRLGSPQAASEYLHSLGIRGIKYPAETLTGNKQGDGTAYNYVVFSDDDVSITARYLRRPFGGIGPAPSVLANAAPQVKTAIDYLRMKFQDKFIPLTRVHEQLQAAGWVKTNDNDAYRAEELFHGKATKRLEDFYASNVQPLLDAIKDSPVSIAELEDYLYAKFAPQRNAYIASINPKLPEGGSGMTDAEARQILADFATAGKTADLERLARQVRAITALQRQIIRNEGLELDETMDAWEATNPDYVPLKGGHEEQGKGIGTGFNVKRSGTKRALGRTSKAENILAELFAQTGATIVRAEKAVVGRAFLKMVEENPGEQWTVYDRIPTTKGTAANPAIRRLKKEIATLQEMVAAPQYLADRVALQRLLAQKQVELANAPAETVQDLPDHRFAQGDNVLTVTLDDGTVKYIELEDSDLARVMKNLTPNQYGAVTQVLAKTLRYLSMMSTSLNPEFMVTNFTRDIQTAMVNLSGEQSAKVAKDVLKGVPAAMKGIHNALRGDKQHAMAQWFARYQKAGAQVSFMDLRGMEAWQRKLENLGKEGKYGIEQARKLGAIISDYNGIIENAARLSAFKVAIEAGMSESDAASLAKNLTVNFNRKGELGPAINALYMFANAGIQGSARILGALKHKNVRRIAGGTMVLAFLLAEANRLSGGDDDDDESKWDKISDFTKQTNFIFLRENGEMVKVRLPYGYNVFVAAGYALNDYMHNLTGKGGKDTVETAKFMASSVMNAFNPFGGDEGFLKILAPTLADPLLEIATNENFMGDKILPENLPFGAQKPDSALYFRNVSGLSKAVAQTMNSLTGGTKWESGAMDVSPETIDHLFGFALGGLGRSVGKLADVPGKALSGDLSVKDVPFLRQVYQQPTAYVDMDRFYTNVQKIEAARANLKQMEGPARKDFLERHPEIQLRVAAESHKKRMGGLRKRFYAARDAGRSAEARQIETQMQQMALRFNKIYNARTQ